MRSESNASDTPFAQPAVRQEKNQWWLLYWSLRREVWESRSLYVAPLAVGAVALFGGLISAFRLPAQIRASASAMQLHQVIQRPYDFVAGLLMLTTTLVAVVYSLDALYGERRDRSILFWKSLPVSDTVTVLAKASIPIVILPLLGFVITVAVQLIMTLASSVSLAASGVGVAAFWEHLSLVRMSLLLLYHLLVVHGLSWAPVFGWMLLVSAWARRVPMVWALLPPIAIAVGERIAFNTSHITHKVGELLSGARTVASSPPGGMPMDPMTTHVTAARFLGTPGFWIGLLLTAMFLAAAIRLRRRQVPI